MFPLSEEGALWFTIALFAVTGALYAARGFWHFLQAAIFTAVLCSNVYWQWTPNPFLAALMGAGAALGITASLNWLTQTVASLRGHHRPPQPEAELDRAAQGREQSYSPAPGRGRKAPAPRLPGRSG